MKEKNTQLLAIALLLAALVLGYLLFQVPEVRKYLHLSSGQKAATEQKTTKELTADEKKMLIIPSNDSPDKEKTAHSALVDKLAKETDTVVVKDCRPTPIALKIKQGQSFKIKNEGKAAITITVNKDHSNVVAAGETKAAAADFGFGPGVYGYACDGPGEKSNTTAGIFWVVQ